MKTKNILLIVCLFFSMITSAQNYGAYNLFASFDFEQNQNDKLGNVNIQLKNGASIVNDAVRGKVLYFDGTNNNHAVISPAPISGDDFTLSFWYKRHSKDDANVGWKQIFEFHNANDDSNIYLMPVYGFDDTKSGIVCATEVFSQGIWEAILGPVINADDNWHHIAIVINGKEWSYYLDGNLVAEKSILGSLSILNPTHLYFGMNPNRGTHPMTSSIDDVNIFHHPLTKSQIAQLYNNETVTDPINESPIIFDFDNNLLEAYNRINLSGTGYSLISDADRGGVVKINSGGQLNFSETFIPNSASTINFLYKKDSFSASDNGKYIYQSSKDDTGYGLKLKVENSQAVIVLEAVSNGVLKEFVGTKKMDANQWYAISIHHSPSASTNKGTMRIYQDAVQTAAAAQVETYSLNLNKWSLGSTTASQSAGGVYDNFVVENYAMTVNELKSYHQSNLTSVNITVDYSTTHQTIRNFGASDAWNADLIGKHWPVAKKEKLAELLFSKEFDEEGNPKGIGLSAWRFNIGAGSAEQGDASKINLVYRRSECFQNSDLSYNWNKQAGQQWFLRKAVLDYDVEDIVGFMNSPPVHFTKHGYAFNKGGGKNYILKNDKYNAFAKFTADVIEHFEGEGISFKYISPINEPQYDWKEESDGTIGQEGTPATNQQIADVVKAMSSEFSNRNLSSQIFIGEAGSITSAISQVPSFWGNANQNMKIIGLPNVSNIVSAHSYWDDGSAQTIYDVRNSLKTTLNNTNPSLEFFQTEYSLLGGGYQWGHPGATNGSYKEIESAMSLARIIHADLTVANATGWHWWTAFEHGNHQGESRFALIEALTTKDLTDGVYNDTKLLYTLGQYSRFVRPGMKRASISRSDDVTAVDALASQMYSAYIDEESNRVVIVAVNSAITKSTVKLAVDNFPIQKDIKFTPYITSDEFDMKVMSKINLSESFVMPPLSVITFVSEIIEDTGVSIKNNIVKMSVFPNPANDVVNIKSGYKIKSVTIYDTNGSMIKQQRYNNLNSVSFSLSNVIDGLYMLRVETDNGIVTEKIMKK